MKSNNILVYVFALTTVVLWGSAFPAVRYSLQFYSPESIMFLRFLVASVFLGTFAVIKKMQLPKKQDLPMFLFASFIGIFGYMWLFNTGTAMVQSGVSSFIVSMSPVITIVLSYIFLKEKVNLYCLIGVFVSFAGLITIAISQTDNFTINLGTVLLICAAIFTSIYSIAQRKLLRTYKPLETTTYCVIFATLFMFIFIPKFITEAATSTFAVNAVIVYLGIFPAAIAYLTWAYALSKAKTTNHVQMFLYLSPFVASILAYFWLGEVLSLLSILGGVIIITGMLIANKLR